MEKKKKVKIYRYIRKQQFRDLNHVINNSQFENFKLVNKSLTNLKSQNKHQIENWHLLSKDQIKDFYDVQIILNKYIRKKNSENFRHNLYALKKIQMEFLEYLYKNKSKTRNLKFFKFLGKKKSKTSEYLNNKKFKSLRFENRKALDNLNLQKNHSKSINNLFALHNLINDLKKKKY
jgi:hypothetical protein